MKSCVACKHSIDDQARLCPYCGADPVTGEKVDTQAVIEQVFHTKKLSAADTVLDYARRRQGIVVALVAIVVFLGLAMLHQFVTARNSTVSSGPAISLSEIADVANEKDDTRPAPMPAPTTSSPGTWAASWTPAGSSRSTPGSAWPTT